VLPEELHAIGETQSCLCCSEACKRLDIDVVYPTCYLKVLGT
jgi:hypothetical protein